MKNFATESISVKQLHLDTQNPRLPERLHGATESEILEYLYGYEVLQELIDSMLINGFFQQEPLLVQKTAPNSYIALEGNRRLGALKIIHHSDISEDSMQPIPAPSSSQIKELEKVPCVVVKEREDVTSYLGFRHISGLRQWAPEAKARYILNEVEKAVESEEEKPFLTVARKLGSNTQGIRNYFFAIRLLMHAKSEFSLPTEEIQLNRFGVWYRCLNSPKIRKFIGIGQPKTYTEIEQALEHLDQEKMAAVISDLTANGRGIPVVADSRQITIYGNVLANNKAYAILRRTGELDLAAQVVNEESLTKQIVGLTKKANIIFDLVQSSDSSRELVEATEDLFNKAKSIRAVAKDNWEEDGD